MVTVQHRPPGIAFWQPSHHHLLPYQAACAPVVPCQWHHAPSAQSVSVPPASFVPALLSPQPPPAATVEPEQPIGYGSFGVVWWELCPLPWCEFLGLASVFLPPFWLPISIMCNCSLWSCSFIGPCRTLARVAGQPWRRSQVSSSPCSPAFGRSEKLRYSVKWTIRMWVDWTYLVCTLHMTLDIHVVIPLTQNLAQMNLLRMTLFCLFPSCSIPFSTVYTVTLGDRSDSTTHFGAVCGCVSLGVCCPILDKLS